MFGDIYRRMDQAPSLFYKNLYKTLSFACAILQGFFFSILHACRIHYLVNSEKQDWTVSDRCSSVYTLKQTSVRHGKAVFLMCSTRGRTKS